MAIDASQVQRAFTSPFNLAGLIQNADQNAAENDAMRKAEVRQQDEDRLRMQQEIDKFYKSTGTPYDQVANQRIMAAKTNLFNALKKNPNLTQSAGYSMNFPLLSDLQRQQDNAIAANRNTQAAVAALDKEHSFLDKTAVESRALKDTYYDENGELRTVIDPTSGTRYINSLLGDDHAMAQVSNVDAVGTQSAQYLDKSYPAQEQIHPYSSATSDAFGTRKISHPSYVSVDPVKGEVIGVTNNAKELSAIHDQLAQSTPVRLQLLNIKDGLSKTIPMWDTMSDVQQNAFATRKLLEQSEPRSKVKFDDPNLDEYKIQLQKQQQNRQQANADRSFGIAQQGLDLRKQEAERRKEAEKDTEYGRVTKLLSGDKSSAQSFPKEMMHLPFPYTDNPMGATVKPFVLSGTSKKDGLWDIPYGSMNKIKVYYEPASKSFFSIEQGPARDRDGKILPGNEYLPIPESIKRMDRGQYDSFIKDYIPQLESKSVNYENLSRKYYEDSE